MRKMMLWIIAVAAAMLSGSTLYAQDVHVQDIAGDWQGTLQMGTNLNAQCAPIDSMVAAEFAKHAVGAVTVGVVYKNQLIWDTVALSPVTKRLYS